MKPRIILAMIALVVIPTAILSLLAGGAVKIRERDLERRLRSSAEQAVDSAAGSFSSHLSGMHDEAGREISSLLADGKPDGLLASAERLRRLYDLIDRIYVFRTPGELLYPMPALDLSSISTVSPTNSGPAAARLDRVRKLHIEGKAYQLAAKEYQRILDLPGVSKEVRASAGIGAALCYRRLGKYDFAAGLLRQFAGYYSSGALALRRVVLDPRLAVRDPSGHLYSLIALEELVEVFRVAAMAEVGDSRDRWLRRAMDTESELLERVVFLYDYIVPDRRESLLERLTGKAADGGSGSRMSGERARLMSMLKEQRRNELFNTRERKALITALDEKLGREGMPEDLTWLTVEGSDYSCRQLPGAENTLFGMKIDPAGLSSYIADSTSEIGERQGVRILATGVGIQESGVTAEPAEVPLASGSLTAPFSNVTLRAYPADPDALRRGRALRVGLQRWGVVVLALGVIFGALVVLTKASGELHRAQARSDFVAGVSHDLRTPLSSMRMLAESLYLNRVKDPTKQKRFLNTILRESSRLGSLAERVLFFVRLGDDALSYDLKKTDIVETVRDAVESFALSRQGYDGEVGSTGDSGIAVDVEEGLPEPRVDAAAITQVVLNLLDNAVKYSRNQTSGVRSQESESREDAPPVRVVAQQHEEGIEISVQDHGRGMEKNEIKKIFRKFYRSKGGETDTTPGYGLGLSLCWQIVRAHHGRIEVDSEPGKGSIFRIILPI